MYVSVVQYQTLCVEWIQRNAIETKMQRKRFKIYIFTLLLKHGDIFQQGLLYYVEIIYYYLLSEETRVIVAKETALDMVKNLINNLIINSNLEVK